MIKRLVWLLVVPYVVVCDTDTFTDYSIVQCNIKDTTTGKRLGFTVTPKHKEWLRDFAESLNQAHERRTRKKYADCVCIGKGDDSLCTRSCANGEKPMLPCRDIK